MRRRNACVAALVLAAGGCDWYYNDVPSPDQLWYLVPWFDHMIAAKYVHPYQSAEVPRYTVEGSVPITGGEADWAAEWAAAKTTTADALRNPTVGGADSAARHGSEAARIPADLAARGDSLYRTFCATCHGETGKGEGLVGRRMGALPLVSDRARGFSDGYLYSIVRYGRGLMPRYGDKVWDPRDRWAIVNHVRALQGAAAAPGGP